MMRLTLVVMLMMTLVVVDCVTNNADDVQVAFRNTEKNDHDDAGSCRYYDAENGDGDVGCDVGCCRYCSGDVGCLLIYFCFHIRTFGVMGMVWATLTTL